MEVGTKAEKYRIELVSKDECKKLLQKYHYLSKINKGFKSGFNYGLIENSTNAVVGVCIYTGFPVPELVNGLFGLPRTEQAGMFELSRLCILPDVQKTEYNITSWFLSRTIKLLRKETNVRSILSYADADFHSGTIYRACNFAYYGLTAEKKDFWFERDGEFVKHQRGPVKGLKGEWRPRSRKHRYLLVYDKSLNVKWSKDG